MDNNIILSIINNLSGVLFTSKFIFKNRSLIIDSLNFFDNSKDKAIGGFSDKRLVENNLFVENIFPDDRDELIEKILSMGAGESLKYEFRFKTSEENYIWLRLNITVVAKDEKSVEISGLVEPISKEKNLDTILYTIKEINRLAIKIDREDELLQALCDLLVDKLGYAGAFLGYIDSNKLFRLKFFAKNIPEVLVDNFKKVTISVDEKIPEGRGTVGNAYRSGNIFLISDTLKSELMSPWAIYHKKFGIRSACSIPLFKGNKVEFILIIYSRTPDLFSEEYMGILDEIKVDISFALEKIDKERNIKLLSEAMEESPEWFLIADETGTILHVNKAVEKISGYSADEIIGNKLSMFISDFYPENLYNELIDKISKGERCECEVVRQSKDKSVFYLDTIFIPVFFDNKVYRFVELSRDITKEKLQQEKISELTRLYVTLSDINQLIVRADSIRDLYQMMNEILVKDAGFSIVYFTVIDDENKLKLYNFYYQEDDFSTQYRDFLKFIEESYKEEFYVLIEKGFVSALSIKNKEISYYNDLITSSKTEEIKERFKGFIFLNACAAIPIFKNNKVIGSIVCCSAKKDFFTPDIIKLLNEIGSDISFALGKIEMERFNAMTSTALNSGSDFVMITDKNFKIVYVNDNTEKIFGYARDELIGKHHSIISSRSQSLGFARRFYRTIRSGQKFSDFFVYRSKDGEKIYSYTTITPFLIRGEVRFYVAVGKDITQAKSLEDSLQRLKDYDPLTGLLNRNKFIENADEFLSIAKYEKKLASVCIINPIGFSSINQAYGFYTGDLILCEIANRIRKTIREYDLIGKLESDMFVILLEDIATLEDVLNIISKLNLVLEKPYDTPKKKEILVSFNFGVSFFPNDGENAQLLVERANIGLGSIKSNKDKRIGFYKKDFEQSARIKLDLKSKLEKAIINKEFILYYQPIFSIKDKSIVGAEALLRWKSDGQIILPMNFIPVLEEMGRIMDVEKFVVDSVCSKLKDWEKKEKKMIPISVNLSERSFKDESFRRYVIYTIRKYGIHRGMFSVELVERTFVEDFERCLIILKKFSREGVFIYLDDFGTGFSSFNYLYKLKFDSLKIDKSFLSNIEKDIRAKSIVESIIFLNKRLNLKTVAEGVETLDQLKILEELGCEYVQGFLLAKPMPEEEFEELIRTT
ncbi:diguanylate cyclase/phosphodiesterase with PAS/PAC and GAF sensor(s) [Thermodesulfobium narugense DSM 14796]|uniref:Diguanylate cyclase/phosphodiesterase with PAS/PAC and GAF sensor(S) n=1 Tax=Thermodesulfobium narugense DSM 14796 TaxID=747365 RepID=M1E519_9BACT|nr:EAL domain-containing protein [Thermodesulfobium narugense]AEE14747.1 diguanylate cyclase/phosphodiesterase with PAS/PAC and GAF sensor(s) [Thermodesulfobium narugense DSM 14796]